MVDGMLWEHEAVSSSLATWTILIQGDYYDRIGTADR